MVEKSFNKEKEIDKPNIVQENEKYPLIEFQIDILQDDALVQMLINGNYDRNLVRNSLDESSYFMKSREMAPWRIIVGLDHLEDDEVESAAKRMDQQFVNREVTESGEMLHIFSLRLMMVEKEILNRELSVVVAECKEYLDDILNNGTLPPREMDWRWMENFADSYGGFSYWISEKTKEHFSEIRDYLIASREKALEVEYPERTVEILKLMSTNGEKFKEQLCTTHTGNNLYVLIPILSHIPPKDFVDAWMKSPKKNWRSISSALNERYKLGRSIEELNAEKGWVGKVKKLMKAEAKKADGFAKLRITRAAQFIP